jgi:hypothetical protein
MTKPLSHASVVVNRLHSTRIELIRLAEVLSYLILTGVSAITVYDSSGALQVEKRLIEQFVRRKLEETGLHRRGGSLAPSENSGGAADGIVSSEQQL